jgi:glycosyltransferase involved in cell wall biosynthesis
LDNPERTGIRQRPQLSVIIPAYNAGATLGACLAAIFAQAADDVEVIVVDDGSQDDTRQVALRYPATLLVLPHNQGPSAARNYGVAHAKGEFLFFIDADVALGKDALARGRELIAAPGIDAVVGSYDDEPAVRTLVSQFKNLAHHYFHQRSGPEATTLFGACSVIRRELFVAVGGFDEQRRLLEDVDLGYRLTARGARIRLEPGLQVKHLKHWTLALLLRTDVTRRAIPWVAMWLDHRQLPKDLNFDAGQRLAAGLALTMGVLALAAIFNPRMLIALLPVFATAVWINRGLYRLFRRRGGIRLMVAGFFLQQFYYLYSVAGVVVGVVVHYLENVAPAPEKTPD